ncbi:hypothetical protein EAO71_07195 [Streptomyces sp. ms191]|uniref:hypothetical protein n=1 Tax=Streptomyces sp. ms191 TaxID=1827978 RepID=UPI0011CE9486|nr:hypothetical protein [Streptomyces sp. ms191]TXS28594.1 hypothetical protein EAO71_07195 [Streptomyces sp. ms191]
MSDIERAARDAVEAADNSQQLAMVMALLQAQQLTQQPVQQPAPVQQQSTGKWIAIGVGAPFLAVTLAISVIAFAITAVALTICVLVLRGLWADYQKGRK